MINSLTLNIFILLNLILELLLNAQKRLSESFNKLDNSRQLVYQKWDKLCVILQYIEFVTIY